MIFERHMTGEAVECCRPQIASARLAGAQSAPIHSATGAHTHLQLEGKKTALRRLAG